MVFAVQVQGLAGVPAEEADWRVETHGLQWLLASYGVGPRHLLKLPGHLEKTT